MAGDWIKMRMDLQTHPKVVRMMSALNADKFRVIGGLHAVWCIFDVHSADGVLPGYTQETMDAVIGWTGFAKSMKDVGWLIDRGAQGLEMPRFSEHNGKSAKRRAMETERKRTARRADACLDDFGDLSACDADNDADKKRTREEKRREEVNNTPPPPKGGLERFAEFWSAYPKRVARQQCEAKWRTRKLDRLADTIIADVRAKTASEDWRREDGRYIPNPLTYLNQERWADTVTVATPPLADDPRARLIALAGTRNVL